MIFGLFWIMPNLISKLLLLYALIYWLLFQGYFSVKGASINHVVGGGRAERISQTITLLHKPYLEGVKNHKKLSTCGLWMAPNMHKIRHENWQTIGRYWQFTWNTFLTMIIHEGCWIFEFRDIWIGKFRLLYEEKIAKFYLPNKAILKSRISKKSGHKTIFK